MKDFKQWLKLVVTSDSGISSKRVCGVLGFLVISFVLVYCTVCGLQAPAMIDTFIWVVCVLLGIDAVVSPFHPKYKNKDNETDTKI